MGKDEKPEYGPQNRSLGGQWGKWRGVTCASGECGRPAVCRGLCASHYNKQKWSDGHRPPSVNPASRRNAHLKHRYGLAAGEYDKLLAAQSGVCAICKKPPAEAHEGKPRHWRDLLAVDHCHETDKVRGLLCNNCNAGIGHLGTESVALAAARYLRFHAGQRS